MASIADTEPFLKRLFERIDYAPEPRDDALRAILASWHDAREEALAPAVSACRIDDLGAAYGAFFLFARHGPRHYAALEAGSHAAAFLGLDLRGGASTLENRRAAVRLRRLLAEADRVGEPLLVAFVGHGPGGAAIRVEMVAAPVSLPGGNRALFGGVAWRLSVEGRAWAAGRREPRARRLHLFALGQDRALGAVIAEALGIAPSAHEERVFEDGEHKLRPLVDVAGCETFVLHRLHGDDRESGNESVNDRLCRLLFFAATLKDAGAARITAIAPYLCYARKDRRTKSRDPVTTRYLAQLFEAVGIDALIGLEVHNPAAFENAFRRPTTHLTAAAQLCRRLLARIGESEVAVVSPDLGGGKRADLFRSVLESLIGRPVAKGFVEKARSAGVVSGDLFAGDVAGRTAILVDDMIGTGTTILRASRVCREAGAIEVLAVATHGLFTGGATALLEDGAPDGILVTDTVPVAHVDEALRARIEVVPIAHLLADAVRRSAPSSFESPRGGLDVT